MFKVNRPEGYKLVSLNINCHHKLINHINKRITDAEPNHLNKKFAILRFNMIN